MSSNTLYFISRHVWTISSVTLILVVLFKYIYRLTWHPLAKFPGPRLAAASTLYGAFYDLSSSRSYVKTFPALHERYGPIIRVWPNHLQIQDIDSHTQIFKTSSKFDKHEVFYANPALEGSFINAPRRENYLPRRALLAANFTRESVRRAEPRLTHHLSKFLDKVGHYARSNEPVNLTKACLCLANDEVMEFICQKPSGALDAEAFDSEVLGPISDFLSTFQWPITFPRVFSALFMVIDKLPEWILKRGLKTISTTKECLQMSHDQIAYIHSGTPGIDRPTSIFDSTLNPQTEKGQYTPSIEDMAADSFSIAIAGTHTTATALVVTLFNLLNGSPHMLERLMAELCTAIPDKHTMTNWAALENLPYLRAVIKEGLRLNHGAPGRLPRVVPEPGAIFCGQKVPAGTVVSSCIYVHNMNPDVFPEPDEFRPERWLDADPRLEQNMVSFSRGSRNCLGMNLAYWELYLTLAHLLRRFELTLFETTEKTMEWKDCMVPVSKGPLRVTLRERD